MLAHSFTLLALFLSLCNFASAAPVDFDIVTGSPAALERRVTEAVKDKCPWGAVWIRRECTPTVGPRAWRDVCYSYRSVPHLRPFARYVPDLCPENHFCVNQPEDDDGDHTIRCVSQESDSESGSPKKKKQKTSGAQYGTSQLVTAASGNKNTQIDVDAVIDHDIPGASVSAIFTSMDKSFVVAPNNIIVGKIEGTETTVCKGDKSDPEKARECYPVGQHNLKAKQKVNFTMGLTNGQSGYVHYAAIPDGRIIHDELR